MLKNNSVRRALCILELFTTNTPEYKVMKIARKLGLSRNTVVSLVLSLESCGMLQKSAKEKNTYRLGPKIPALALNFFESIDLKEIALMHLKELNDKYQEYFSIHVIDGDRLFRLAYIESSKLIKLDQGKISDFGMLHAGAPGKLLMAYLPGERVYEILARTGLPRFTNTTIVNREELLKHLEKIRATGMSFSKGEVTEHNYAIAVPIRDYTGTVIAALVVGILVFDYTPKIEKKYITILQKEAQKISQELGYQGQDFPQFIKGNSEK